jgi:hypothetical protein
VLGSCDRSCNSLIEVQLCVFKKLEAAFTEDYFNLLQC